MSLTQKEVAEQVGVDNMTINNWETGRRTPAVRVISRIVKFLRYMPVRSGTFTIKVNGEQASRSTTFKETGKAVASASPQEGILKCLHPYECPTTNLLRLQ